MGNGNLSGFDLNKQVGSGSAVTPCSHGQTNTPPSSVHWIEIEMVYPDGSPCANVKYKIEAPDGSVIQDSLNAVGFAHVPLSQSGNCKITFPDLDKEVWKRR